MKYPLSTVLLTLLSLAITLRAADAPKPDFSSPKNTVKSMYDIIKSGDVDLAKACFAKPANDAEKDLLENGWSDDVLIFPVFAALKEKFPAAAIPNVEKTIDTLKASVDASIEKIEGDKASLTPDPADKNKPASPACRLVKEAGDWKLAIEQGFLHQRSDNMKAMNKAMAAMMADMLTEIKVGKFATVDDAKKAMNDRRQEIQKKFMPPASHPAATSTSHE